MKKFTKEEDLKTFSIQHEQLVSEISERVQKKDFPPYMADFFVDSASRIVADFLKWQLMTGINIDFIFND